MGVSSSAARKSTLLTLFAGLFLVTLDSQVLIPLLPLLSRELPASLQQLGWLFSLYALSAAACNLLLGPLLDRLGRVFFLRVGYLGLALLSLWAYSMTQLAPLLVVRAATGLAAGLVATCTHSVVGDLYDYRRRGRAMGTVLSSYFAALILGIPTGAWIARTWSWQTIFLLFCVLASLLFLASFAALKGRVRPSAPGLHEPYFSVYARIGKRPPMLAALGVSFLASGATLAFLTFAPGYLSASFQLDAVQIAWLFAIAGLAAAVASPVSGWISDRWSKRDLFLVANTALAFFLLLFYTVETVVLLWVVFFLLSLSVAFRQTALHTLQTQLGGSRRRGSFLALRNGFSQLGISLAVLLAGVLYGNWGYAAVLGLAAALTLVSSWLVYRVIGEPDA